MSRHPHTQRISHCILLFSFKAVYYQLYIFTLSTQPAKQTLGSAAQVHSTHWEGTGHFTCLRSVGMSLMQADFSIAGTTDFHRDQEIKKMSLKDMR